MRAHWDDIEERWTGWDSLEIGLGKAIRKRLTETLGEDWLEQYHATLHAVDSTLNSAYVECWLGEYGHHYYLRNGYFKGVGIGWLLSGQDTAGHWFYEKVHEDELSREWLETCFAK